MAARTRAQALVFPWARRYDADQLAAFIEDLWGAASGDDDLGTLDAIEKAVAKHAPAPVPCPLTVRDVEILTEVASGETYEGAAKNLGLSLETVRSRSAVIHDRLGARCAAQATAIAVHHGWLPNLRPPAPAEPLPQLGPSVWKAIYREHAAAMRRRPFTVVEIGPYASRNGAHKSAVRINKGLIDVFQPAGVFEAEVDSLPGGRRIVRARYVGEPSATAQKEAS